MPRPNRVYDGRVGMVPLDPMWVAVVGVSPASYDTFAITMVSPSGAHLDTSAGTIDTSRLAEGFVGYRFGPDSLFDTVGDYGVQLDLIKVVNGVEHRDVTNVATIEIGPHL